MRYANLTKERDSLTHDDCIDVIDGVIGLYRDVLRVSPRLQQEEEKVQAMLDRYFGDADELQGIHPGRPAGELLHIDPRRRH